VHLRFESKRWQLESPKEKVSRFYRPQAENQAMGYCWQQPTGKRLTAVYYAQHFGQKPIEPKVVQPPSSYFDYFLPVPDPP